MSALALLLCAVTGADDLATIGGRVLDRSGRPIAGARVFLEQGLAGPLQVTQSDAVGTYQFTNVLPGMTGVFAQAKGFAIDGRGIRVAVADVQNAADITLRSPGLLSGTILNPRGKPLAGARITRVGLDARKVSIPFAKLARYGIEEPRSDARGRFVIQDLPRGEPVMLKIAHPLYAQEAAAGLKVGDQNAKIKMSSGVLVNGTVIARGTDQTVPNATIYFRTVDPPKSTVIVRAGRDGNFSVRLKPGTYISDASGDTYRSPTLQRIEISGKYSSQSMVLRVAGSAQLRGFVKDAVSGGPVANARVVLEAYGVPRAVTRTGPTGRYEFAAAQGETVVRVTSAPGFINPPESAVRMDVQADRAIEVPTFWVAPIPRYSLEVIDRDEQPVAGAIVRVLRPSQFGWHTTNADGYVTFTLDSLPSDGSVLGFVEHPDKSEGAVFSIERNRAGDAIVQLLPFSSVSATVRSQAGKPLPGVAVASRFATDRYTEPVTLWRSLTGKDGTFRWDGVPLQVPQLCVAATKASAGVVFEGHSKPFVAKNSAPLRLDDIVILDGVPGRSTLGRTLKWSESTLVCGQLPEKGAPRVPAVVVYVGAEQAAIAAEALQEAKRILNRPNLHFALIIDGDATCPNVSFPVLKGKAPGSASTYLIAADGKVVLETFGLPPVFEINRIAPRER